jgi:hypothetical protein
MERSPGRQERQVRVRGGSGGLPGRASGIGIGFEVVQIFQI